MQSQSIAPDNALDALFALARAHFEETVACCKAIVRACGATLTEMEQVLHERQREGGRLLVEATIAGLRPRVESVAVTTAEGKERRWHRESERTVLTTFGPIAIARRGYFGAGGSALFPLDGLLNLPADSHMSFSMLEHVARESARGSFEQACATVKAFLGVAPGKRQAEEATLAAVLDFQEFYDTRARQEAGENGGAEGTPTETPECSDVLAMSTDGKGVVVRTEDLRESTRAKAEGAKNKLSKRLSSGEKANRKRMAQVATVYDIAPFQRTTDDVVGELAHEISEAKRPRPSDKRVWANITEEPETVIAEMFAEAKRRDPSSSRSWVVLIDGNRAQRQAVERAVKECGREVVIIADLIHVIEYLWGIVWLFFPEGDPEGQAWVTARLRMILDGKSKEVCRQVRRFAARRGLEGNDKKRVEDVAKYLTALRPYLRYDVYLAQGLPIATGVIEGACRHLVKDRMDITGARWSVEGAEAVLRLRSLVASHDFDAYWVMHQEIGFQETHAARYADPSILRRARLRAV
jgi:hypothetical protein